MINYAHRGASAYAPENTMAAFELGLAQGANGTETDIQRTRDGVLVLHHDDTLRRVAGVDARVRDLTFDELSALDFGLFFGETFAGEKPVTLAAFCARFFREPIHFALELKAPGLEEEVLAAIKGYDPARVIVTAFDLTWLERMRALDARLPLGYLTRQITPETLDALEALRIGQICPQAKGLRVEDMRLARERGFSVRAWGIADEALMRHALALGVDGMTVNFPDRLAAAMEETR